MGGWHSWGKILIGGDGIGRLWWCHTELTDDLNFTFAWTVRSLWKWVDEEIYGWFWLWWFWAVCVCVNVIHTSWLCAKPCLRKIQAGPTKLCSMLQFLTRAHRGSSKSRSLPPSSSSSVSTSPAPPRPPTMAAANGEPLRSTGDSPLKGGQPTGLGPR